MPPTHLTTIKHRGQANLIAEDVTLLVRARCRAGRRIGRPLSNDQRQAQIQRTLGATQASYEGLRAHQVRSTTYSKRPSTRASRPMGSRS